jgi:superfamily II DNA or RNA helicase
LSENAVESDLTYHPVLRDAEGDIAIRRPARVLVVGDEIPNFTEAIGSLRFRSAVDVALPTGLYRFAADDGVVMLFVTTGGMPGPPMGTDWNAPGDHPLVNAYAWFCEWWDDATGVERPRFDVGDEVVTVPAGQEAKIRGREFDAGRWWYRVRVEGRTVSVQESGLTAPETDDDPLEWVSRSPATARRFAATLTRAKLLEQLTDTVYSFRATRTIFRPYQFRPVMRLLNTGRLRLLIADEVGLGKTIEAGLVWTELDARNQANRVLVVCPSMLVPKWRAEMDERFGFDLTELTKDGLDDLLDRLETDRMPGRYQAVCSLERLRVWEGLERFAELGPQFDLVIADEAHAFRNSGTKSNALGALLSDWADALVFLSATPLNLGNEDLYNLLELLAPGEFDNRFVLEQRLEPNVLLNRIAASFFDRDIDNSVRKGWLDAIHDLAFGPAVVSRPEYARLDVLLGQPALGPGEIAEAKRLVGQLHALSAVVTRTRKVEIQDHKAVREAIPINVQWTPLEASLYQAFDQWQRESAHKRGLPVGFVTQMPLRLASTCLPAARDKVLAMSGGDWEDDDLDESDPTDSARPEPEFAPPPELVDLARHLGDVDTKFDAFLAALLPIVAQEKRVLVFTFSRAALAYLQRRLQSEVRLAVLHGGVTRDERHVVMQRFREGDYDVVLASRVASEGLDFEFCSAVVNYDLPWNPMEVEQRIGRIDRFGQTGDKVFVLNFHTPGTIETDIIERVHQRIGVFRDSIGELEPILQSRMTDLRRTMFDFNLTEDQRSRRIDEMLTAIEEQRLTKDDLENASSYLSSTDKAEIDGLENDLLSQGRYIGQAELVLLLEDWAGGSAGASCRRSTDGARLLLRGNAEMEAQLRGVSAAGERSASELDHVARALRDEREIALCLDQELARVTGEPLLTATHPLTRAALRVPGLAQARFASVRYESAEVEPGRYLVSFAIARWRGVRAANEFWTAAVALETQNGAPATVGAGLLAALAESEVFDGEPVESVDLMSAVQRTQRQLRRKQADEEARRIAENEALTETRRISLRETHIRKVGQIQRRIETLREAGKTKVIHLQQAQLHHQERYLQEAEAKLDHAQVGSMDVEQIAVSIVEVVRP